MSTDASGQELEQELEPEPESGADEVDLVVENALTQNPAIVLDLLIAALGRAKDALQVSVGRWHVVIAPDAEPAYVKGFDSFEGLLSACRDVHGKGYQIFGFSPKGELLLPSRGGQYLVTPWGRHPLFVADDDSEVDPSGYVGPVPIKPAPAAAAANGNGEDEKIEEEDEADEGGVDEGLDDEEEDDDLDEDVDQEDG
jgi:hypothetical protein